MKCSLVMLTALLSSMAAGIVLEVRTAKAQANWSDNGPVYESDLRRQAEQDEAERAARRKTYAPVEYPKYMEGGDRPDIPPVEPPVVYFDQPENVGSIIVDTQNRKLYYVLAGKKAYAYPISVGRDGFTWSGTEKISRIAEWPSWTPPPEMRKRIAGLPVTVSGGLKNPQGARALYLGNTIYRIHGTNNDSTVGRANSSGCFRLKNEHVVHLASIAKTGTKVKVLPTYNGSVSENAPLSSLFGSWSSEPEQPAPKPKQKMATPSKKQAAKVAAGVVPPSSGRAAAAVSADGKQAAVAPAASATAAISSAPAAATSATDALAEAKAAAEAARRAADEAVAAAEVAKVAAEAAKKAAAAGP